MRKRIVRVGLFLKDVARQLFSFGSDDSDLQTLPGLYRSGPVDDTVLQDRWDQVGESFPGVRTTDAQLTIRADGPAKVLAIGYELEDDDGRKDPVRAAA